MASFKLLLLLLFVLSAVPLAYIISLERAPPPTHTISYYSAGFIRECSDWDALERRFLVSLFDGGIGEVRVPDDYRGEVLQEVTMVKDADLAGNSSLGLTIDRLRNRVLVVNTDVLRRRNNALAAYDLSTWKRIFLTPLSSPAFADDLTVDPEGNAYVTDAAGSKLWKVSKDGELLGTIRSPLFVQKRWYQNLVGLNGIVYHPDGYLLVIHTFSGKLFKVDLSDDGVTQVNVKDGPLLLGDGILLLSPTRLVVVASSPSARLMESSDGWQTAAVVSTFRGPPHRMGSAAVLKDGKVYLNLLLGMGFPKKKHTIVEAVFPGVVPA